MSLPIVITPPWWRTNTFRAVSAGVFLAVLWAAYLFRMRQVQHAFDMTLEARVGERTRIARELHDTLLQSFHGLLLRFQTVLYLLPERPADAKETLEGATAQAARAITEGRDAVQGLRPSDAGRNDLAVAISTLGDELAAAGSPCRPPTLRVAVEGHARDLRPIVRDEIYKVAAEAFGTRTGTPRQGRSKLRSATTTRNSACGYVTMARASTRRCSPARGSRDTMDCAACPSGPR